MLARQLKHVGLSCDREFFPGPGLTAVAVNGLEAVQRLRGTSEFDCVLMDLEMPVMDGYTATRTVRQEEATRNAIVALSTSRDATEALTAAGNARQAQLEERMKDFDGVIVKPYRLVSGSAAGLTTERALAYGGESCGEASGGGHAAHGERKRRKGREHRAREACQA